MPGLRGLIEEGLKPIVVGKDPRTVTRLWDEMFYGTTRTGPKGIQTTAIGAIDIACWDIVGKAAGLPISDLLGGSARTTIPVYLSIGLGWEKQPEEMLERVQAGYAARHRAFKIRMDWNSDRQDANPAKDLEMFRLCREFLPPEVPLSFDANNGYSVSTAIRQGRAFEELGIAHFEEPLPQYDYLGLRQVADALDVPVSSGEQEHTRWQFRDLIQIGNPDILQPDIVMAGGITESPPHLRPGDDVQQADDAALSIGRDLQRRQPAPVLDLRQRHPPARVPGLGPVESWTSTRTRSCRRTAWSRCRAAPAWPGDRRAGVRAAAGLMLRDYEVPRRRAGRARIGGTAGSRGRPAGDNRAAAAAGPPHPGDRDPRLRPGLPGGARSRRGVGAVPGHGQHLPEHGERPLPAHPERVRGRRRATGALRRSRALRRSAVFARACRTYPSFVRQHHAVLALREHFPVVSWDRWLDQLQGVDMLVVDARGLAAGVALSTETAKARTGRPSRTCGMPARLSRSLSLTSRSTEYRSGRSGCTIRRSCWPASGEASGEHHRYAGGAGDRGGRRLPGRRAPREVLAPGLRGGRAWRRGVYQTTPAGPRLRIVCHFMGRLQHALPHRERTRGPWPEGASSLTFAVRIWLALPGR